MNWDKEKDRLLESQKTRDNLMKWKLIIIASVGAAALGFTKSNQLPNSELALCLIPFACCYIDLLCRNLSIRTKMIGKFLAENEEPLELYYLEFKKEKHGSRSGTKNETEKVLSLESLALRGSTIFVSVVIIPAGIIIYIFDLESFNLQTIWPTFLFLFAGVSKILISFGIEKKYRKQRNRIYPKHLYGRGSQEKIIPP